MAEHRPVLLSEAVEALALRADGIYIDATFVRRGSNPARALARGPHGVRGAPRPGPTRGARGGGTTGPVTAMGGTSAEGDIEMGRVKGVHGPGVLDVIIVGV